MKQYSQKQIEKYKRQKYISALNKCAKNLYKLFRDEKTTYQVYKTKFILIKKELDKCDTIRVNSEHLKKTQEYIENLYKKTILDINFNQDSFNKIKNSEISELNRLQKMKNRVKYNKTKHKEIFL